MDIDIKTQTDVELKAIAFDLQAEIQRYQNALRLIVDELNSRAQGEQKSGANISDSKELTEAKA